MEYLPFGETLVDEHTNSYNSPFKYNGKEFDEETGNYYYGARYYDPRLSIFISVDPLAEQAPDWTPYRYGFNNPIKYTDPTGMYEENGDPPLKNIIINFLRDEVKLGNYDNKDFEKNGWKVIDVTSMQQGAIELENYLGGEKANNIFINTHGGALDDDGAINAQGISIFGSDLLKYNYDCKGLRDIDKEVIGGINTISNMLKEDGNLIFAACFADRGHKIGTELSKMNPDINIFLSGDYCTNASDSSKGFKTSYTLWADRPRILESNFSYGMSQYKGGQQVSTGFNTTINNLVNKKE